MLWWVWVDPSQQFVALYGRRREIEVTRCAAGAEFSDYVRTIDLRQMVSDVELDGSSEDGSV